MSLTKHWLHDTIIEPNEPEEAQPMEDHLIYAYTVAEATDDGILFDIRQVHPQWQKGLFSHVTTNLMNHGYFKEDRTVNLPNLLDLLNQSLQIVKRESENFTKQDWFFSGEIELPSGTKQQVFICQNETAKYTVMLPSDY